MNGLALVFNILKQRLLMSDTDNLSKRFNIFSYYFMWCMCVCVCINDMCDQASHNMPTRSEDDYTEFILSIFIRAPGVEEHSSLGLSS